jgi:hypothetical protein
MLKLQINEIERVILVGCHKNKSGNHWLMVRYDFNQTNLSDNQLV